MKSARISARAQKNARESPADDSQNSSQNTAPLAPPSRRVLATLTDSEIRAAAPRRGAYELRDGRGLYLLVTPSGGKWWRFDYRIHGKRNNISLGVYPDVSLALARERREDARRLVAKGLDPSAERKQARHTSQHAHATTFEPVAKEWLAKHPLAPPTLRKIRYLFSAYVYPAIGSKPISLIAPADLLALLRPLDLAGKRETAHRTKQTMGQVFRYAVATGRATHDPTAVLTGALSPVVTTHYAAVTTPAQIGRLLVAIEAYEGLASVKQALKLAPYVFVRPGELRHAKWSEIDWAAKLWRIPAEKMKMRQDHLVPLSRQAVAILKALQPWTGDGAYVFAGLRNQRPISNNSMNAALRSMGFDKHTMTAHGFRAMASTRLHEMGFPSDVIERQLAHRERNQSKAAYNRAQFLKERTAMMKAWSDELDRLRKATTTGTDRRQPAARTD